MEVTIIEADGNLQQIILGSISNEVKEWINQLNNNPLEKREWTYREGYCNKTMWDLALFLGVK